jgi:hypothetical protein
MLEGHLVLMLIKKLEKQEARLKVTRTEKERGASAIYFTFRVF